MNSGFKLDLHLLHCEEARHPPAAWLIRDGTAEEWLTEITRWKLDEQQLSLFVMPASRTDPTPAGLFVTTKTMQEPRQTPAAIAFAAVAQGFYIPVHASLLPAMETHEIEALKTCPTVLFDPAIGPVGFDVSDAMTVADLINSPRERKSYWTSPPMEIEPHTKIESIGIRPVPMSLADLFGEESSDIGSDPPDELTGAQPEPKKGPLDRGIESALKAANWLLTPGKSTSKAGGTGGGLRPFHSLKSWIEDRLQASTQKIERARERALHELIEQLQKNPEEALKHALPIGSGIFHRGIVPPGARLGNRTTDFSLRRLGGGRPVDPWHLQEKLKQDLRNNYLRIAEHERQIGRFRRAAYIHAELLGDLPTAAQVLAEGMFWHEAALLYRDHLHNPMEAARCFVEARMIQDAVEIYRRAEAFEKLGDLYRKLGEEEKANAAFREWAERLKSEKKFTDAADVLHDRLSAREEALALLESAWPDHPDTRRCLQKCLAMRGAHGEHDQAAALVRRLAGGPFPGNARMELLQVFAKMQTHYPDRAVRQQAEDYGRQMIAKSLAKAGDALGATEREMLHLLPSLAPDDRLLSRDAVRFSTKRPPGKQDRHISKPPKQIAAEGSHEIEIKRLLEFRLPFLEKQRGGWLKATASGHGIWAIAAVPGQGLMATRTNFDGHHQSCVWDDRPDLGQVEPAGLLLSRLEGAVEHIFLSAIGAPHLIERSLSSDNGFAKSATVGAPRWLNSPVMAATYSVDGILWAVRITPTGAIITGYHPNGKIVTNFPAPPALDVPLPGDAATPISCIHLAAARSNLLFATGNTLYRFETKTGSSLPEPVLVDEFDEVILGLEAARPWEVPHVKVVLPSQVALSWLEPGATHTHIFDVKLENAVTAFTSDGYIVAIAPDGGYIFAANKQGKVRSARFRWHAPPPVAVGCGPMAGTFSILNADGLVQVFEFLQRGLKP